MSELDRKPKQEGRNGMKNLKLKQDTGTNTQARDAFSVLPGVAHVKRAMEVAAAGGHGITIIDCNGYEGEYYMAYSEINPLEAKSALKLIVLKPCPCGNLTSPERACRCSMAVIRRYQGTTRYRKALAADIVVDAGYIRARDFDTSRNEPVVDVLKRIKAMGKASSALTEDAEQLLDHAYTMLHMNAGERDRAVQVAVTIAGLDRAEHVEARHIAEAIQYRFREILG